MKVVAFTIGLLGAADAFAPTAAVPESMRSLAAARPKVVQMSAEVPAGMGRRAMLAAALLGAPAAANAMAVPGFNTPALIKAKKQPLNKEGYSGDNFATIRDAETNHFWSPKGIVDSVPKVKGIITPKSTLVGELGGVVVPEKIDPEAEAAKK